MVWRMTKDVMIPAAVTAVWLWFAACICQNTGGFDWFRYWLIAGFPYGISRMRMILVPVNYGLSGSLGVFALDCILGGLIGGLALVFYILKLMDRTIRILMGNAMA